MKPLQTLAVDDINLSDMKFWDLPTEEREGAFLTLREQRPLAWFKEPASDAGIIGTGGGYRAVTRYADVLEVSRRPETFCSSKGVTSILDLPPKFLEYFGGMINLDDPRHARLRRIVSAAFTPKMLRKIEADIDATAHRVVENVRQRGECDFVADVAAALPLRIICEMMGVPASDYETVYNSTNVVMSYGDAEYIPEGMDVATAMLTAGQTLTELVQELGRHRRDNPTDDLTSALVNTDVEGERLSSAELGAFFILLAVGGNETTRNAISHGLRALTDHPDQRELWMSDFDGITPTAIEEVVRWASPVIWMRRTTTCDVTLAREQLHEGDKLLLFYNSANRDAAVFDNPYRFDLRRDPNPHVAFGGPGPHFCLGAHLARREITAMFRELFRAMPDIRVDGPPVMLRSSFIHGVKHLPARWTPTR